jgi:signal transduction histidine kinase
MSGKIIALHPRHASDERSDLADRIQQLREQRRANVSEFKALCSEAQRLRSEARDIRTRSQFLRDQVAGIQQQLLNGGVEFRAVWDRDNHNGSKPLVQILSETQNILPQDEILRRLNGSLLTVMEEERSRIARELHDDLNQNIAVLKIRVSTLQQNPPSSPDEVSQKLHLLAGGLDELSIKISEISRQLHPAMLTDLGLEAAMRSLVTTFGLSERIKVSFRAFNVPRELPHQAGISLYRIVQEALHNISKHARAKKVRVSLSAAGKKRLRLVIHDYGVGFNPNLVRRKRGLGLISMEERARLIQGTFSVSSKPGKGTKLEVRVPLPSKKLHPQL